MKISKVKIKNFRGYGENLNDSEGFYLFEDLDKYNLIILNGFNGHGKTSFFDAIEWCLTGQIRRINQILLDNSYKNISKRSWNLKFNKYAGDEREAANVEIEFDNGYLLRRTSTSVSLHDYTDEFYLINDRDIEYKNEDAEKELIKEITSRNLDLVKVYKSIALGQETLTTFLREESPADRNDDLMNLLNLEDLNLLERSSDTSKFFKLNNLKYDEKLNEIEKLKISINNIFQSSGFKLEKYISEVNNKYQELIKKYESNIKYELDESKISSTVEFISYLNNEKDETVVYISNLKDINSNIKKCIRLSKYYNVYNQYNTIRGLTKIDIGSIEKRIASVDNRYNKYSLYLDKFTVYNKELEKEELKMKKLMKTIKDRENCYISNEEIDTIFNELSKWSDIDLKKADTLKIRNKKLRKYIEDKENNINIKEAEISQLTIVNKEYKAVLDDVKSFIEKNDIESCPVCKNKDIYTKDIKLKKEDTVKIKLLQVINNTISHGKINLQGKINNLDQQKKSKHRLEEIYKKYVIDIYIGYFNIITGAINDKFSRINLIMDKINTNIVKVENKQLSLVNSLENFKNAYKNVIGKDYKKDDASELTIKEAELKSKSIEFQKNIIKNYPYINFDNIKNEIELIKIKLNLNKVKINELFNEVVSNIKEIQNKTKILIDIDTVLKNYSVSEANLEELRRYEKIKNKEESLKSVNELIKNFKDDRIKIYDLFHKKSQNLLKTRLEAYKGLGNYIYGKISPHPFYREFDFRKMYGGLEVTTKNNKNINLSHIFSNAQVNILALSIFLGLGLSDNKININQLFVDDPIQSMDDINILAFIDLLRIILLSKKINKQLILSTHDENFCDLLKIKLRNVNYKEIRFSCYGEEGPIIEESINKICCDLEN